MASTNIGLILIKDGAPAENLRVPPFILQALLRSAGASIVGRTAAATVIITPAQQVNNNMSTYLINNDVSGGVNLNFQCLLNALQFATKQRADFHGANHKFDPAIYYNINSGIFEPVVYINNGENKGDINTTDAGNAESATRKIVRFKAEDIESFRTTIWEKLPEFTTTPMAAQIDLVNFATRIKLITTVFAKIYEILQVDPVVKTLMDTTSTTYINAAYDVNTVALPGGGAGAGAGAAGGAFTRFFKTFIIEGGMASQSFINAADATTIPSTSKVDVELSMHYTGPTTEGSLKLFDAEKTTPEDMKKMELFFEKYLNATDAKTFKGGFRRQRNRKSSNRKSSKRRSQKKSSKRRGRKSKVNNKRKGKKSRKRSYKK
jgi:hypothetical protein